MEPRSLLYDKAQYAEARDAFQKLTAIDAKAVAGFVFLGISEYNLKDYNSALRDLDTARTLGLPNTHPLAQSALTYLAILLNKTGMHDEAARLLLGIPLPLKKPPAILEAIGLTGLRIAKLPEELTDSEKDLATKVGAALAASSTDASAQMAELIKAYPERPNLHYLYGMVLLHGDSSQALQEFQNELKIAPASVPSMLAIAHEMERRSQWGDARLYAERAAKAEPGSFETHAMLGRILVSQGHVPEGLSELEKAKSLGTGQSTSLLRVGFRLRETGAEPGRAEGSRGISAPERPSG